MIDTKLEKLKYETTPHHRQILRNQIDQNMIDQIQISNTPSLNYQDAYKSLHFDQLQKSVHLHNQKKTFQQTKRAYDILVAGEHKKVYDLSQHQPFKNSISAINFSNLNYKDVDYANYDLLKQTKALDYTLKNYDGGQGFYRNHDKHIANQKTNFQNMRTTLLRQLYQKNREKLAQEQNIRNQQEALRNKSQLQRYQELRKQQKSITQKSKQRDQILDQIQEERIRRVRRSIFNYNNISRHNPITNPIQYHIDNPYILKQIQNQQQRLRN